MPHDLKKLFSDVAAALKERVDAAKDDAAKDAAAHDFLDELKDGLPDVYQSIATSAAGAARGDEAKRTARAQKKVEALQAELEETRTKLEEAEKAKPDVAAATAKLEARLKKAEDAAAAEKRQHSEYVRGQSMRNALVGLEASLVRQGMRPRVAKGEVLRLQAEGYVTQNEDGDVEFRDLKNKANTYAVNGGDPWDATVAAVIKAADPVDIVSKVQGGGGTSRNGGNQPGRDATGGNAGRGPFGRTEPVEVVHRDDNGAETKFTITEETIADKRAAMGMR